MSGTLQGVLVVALEQAVAAPYATRLLADAGARVIKIERAEGDFARGYDRAALGRSSYFVWLNAGKESIVLDLKAKDDRAFLDGLLTRADVFVQNLGPGATARLGLDAASTRKQHPQLVTCTIAGFPEDGPDGERKAYDLIIQAESGLASITGGPEAPGRVGISICDIATGLTAYSAILEALIARARTGEGKDIRLSLFDVITEWISVPYLHARYGSGAPRRIGLAHPSIAPYGVFETLGAPIMIAIQNEREWHRFCAQVLEKPELADDPRFKSNNARVDNRIELDAMIQNQFLAAAREDLINRLREADIVYGSVNGVEDLIAHPAVRIRSVATPDGDVAMPAPPQLGHEARMVPATAPELDAQGKALRAEFGRALPVNGEG